MMIPPEFYEMGRAIDESLLAEYGEECIEKIARISRFETMRDFLSVLFSPYFGEGFIELRAIRPSGSPIRHWFPVQAIEKPFDMNELRRAYTWAQDASQRGFGVYVGVLPRTRRGGGSRRDVASAGVMWCDLDFKVGGENGEDAAWGAMRESNPDMVVHSGNGLHLYWFIGAKAGLTQRRQEVKKTFETRLRNFQQDVQAGTDSVQDVSRVLRLPPFPNLKDKDEPKSVFLVRMPEIVEKASSQSAD